MVLASLGTAVMALLFVLLLLLPAPLGGFETHYATNQDELYEKISMYGNRATGRTLQTVCPAGKYMSSGTCAV